jgi:carbamoyltransferase
MSRVSDVYGPTNPWLGSVGYQVGRGLKLLWPSVGFHRSNDRYSRQTAAAFTDKLKTGEPVYLLGVGPGGHNSGVALVEASSATGLRIICNNEEERFSGVKHDCNYPQLAVEDLLSQMLRLGIRPAQIHACLATWDYVRLPATIMKLFWEELPGSLTYLNPKAQPAVLNMSHIFGAYRAPKRLAWTDGIVLRACLSLVFDTTTIMLTSPTQFLLSAEVRTP